MKKSSKTMYSLLATGAVLALVSGCIPSLNPFYTAKDLTFDEQLLGEWKSKEDNSDKESWKFERGEDKAYKVTLTEKDGKKATCAAHLFKLKDELFLDFIPHEIKFAENQSELVAAAIFPGHLLARISRSGEELKLAFFDFDWLAKFLEQNPKALEYHQEEKRIVLTAKTSELQRFVLQHLKGGELFEKPGELVRQ